VTAFAALKRRYAVAFIWRMSGMEEADPAGMLGRVQVDNGSDESGALRPSLSTSHNSNEGEFSEVFTLNGSQRKTAYALEKNVAQMFEEAGLERIGFLTLTVGDWKSCEEGCASAGYWRSPGGVPKTSESRNAERSCCGDARAARSVSPMEGVWVRSAPSRGNAISDGIAAIFEVIVSNSGIAGIARSGSATFSLRVANTGSSGAGARRCG